MTNLAKQILNTYNSGTTNPVDMLALNIGETENEVAFIIEQLRCKELINANPNN